MGLYLVARLSGSRGFGPVGVSTLQATLSKLKSWLQRETGEAVYMTIFSSMSYPLLFRVMSRVADIDARSAPHNLACQNVLPYALTVF